MVLIGDIGGTHARLALVERSAERARTVARKTLESRGYPSLEAIVQAFLSTVSPKPKKLRSAAFGVAGPVVNGRCVATNLPWTLDERVLARKLGIPRVTLLNDLVALALGTIRTPRSKIRPLGDAGFPKKKGANVAVLAAGTGLGEAILIWDGARFVSTATEGGHTDFGPRDHLEVELLEFLRARHGHVSWERLLSGAGLGSIYDFFRQSKNVAESAANAQAVSDAPDRNAAIAQLGMSGASDAASKTVHLFASIYGAEAGNLVLKTLSVGGVYVCGNIAGRMLPVLEQGGFMRAFVDKGRFAPLMEKVPVAVVMDSDVGLAGAASAAFDGE